MSMWTHIQGTIKVCPMGRTQAEKTYILQTILEHLPKVTGSERDMSVYVNMLNGATSYDSCDEFGNRSNLLVDTYGSRSRRGWLKTSDYYMLTVQGDLRDRDFDTTYKDFVRWLCRLSKRCNVCDILVCIKGYDRCATIEEHGYEHCYRNMFESPSWCSDNHESEIAWAEYLMWQRADDYNYPALLAYKYINDEKNDKKVINWIGVNNKAE